MFFRNIVTLNIEPNEIRFLVIRGKRIVDWGSAPLASGLIRQGLMVEPARVSSALAGLFSEKKLSSHRVIVSLTGLRSTLRILSLPKLKSSLVDEALRHEAEREMPIPLDELQLVWQFLGAENSEHRFMVLGVPDDLLNSEIRALASAGIKPHSVNLKPLALARAVNREEALIINLEHDDFDLVAVAGGFPIIMRTVILKSEGMALEDIIGQVAGELSRTIGYHNRNHPGHPISPSTPVFLTGMLANSTTAHNLFTSLVHNPIEALVSPFECPPDLPLAQYAVNLGLAHRRTLLETVTYPRATRQPIVNPNVIPQRYGLHMLSPARILYPIAAIFLVALLFVMYQAKTGAEGEIAGIQDELNSVNQQLSDVNQVVSPLVAKINDAEAEANRLREEREFILSVLGTSGLADSLQLVLDAVPPEVRLTSINETADQIDLNGDADNGSSVANFVITLEQTGLFAEVYATSLSMNNDDMSVTFSVTGYIGKNS